MFVTACIGQVLYASALASKGQCLFQLIYNVMSYISAAPRPAQ